MSRSSVALVGSLSVLNKTRCVTLVTRRAHRRHTIATTKRDRFHVQCRIESISRCTRPYVFLSVIVATPSLETAALANNTSPSPRTRAYCCAAQQSPKHVDPVTLAPNRKAHRPVEPNASSARRRAAEGTEDETKSETGKSAHGTGTAVSLPTMMMIEADWPQVSNYCLPRAHAN